MSPHSLGVHAILEPRPTSRRQRTLEAIKSRTSLLSLKEASDNPHAGIEAIYVGIAVSQKDNGVYRYAVNLYSGVDPSTSHAEDLVTFHNEDSSDWSSDAGSRAASPLAAEELAKLLATTIKEMLTQHREEKLSKPVGAGLTEELAALCPQLAVLLWSELDIVPFVFASGPESTRDQASMSVEEQAEHMARKTYKEFGPNRDVHLTFGHRNDVEVDSNGRTQITDIASYHDTVNMDTTWAATMQYADSLRRNNIKIAFFNSTAQGGGVALMRHALIRFLRLIGVNCTWYVPKGRPEVFRITKDNHNILQGVAEHGERLTSEKITELDDWALHEAEQCRWLEYGGPLSPRDRGGADVIIVDDPQMPSLVKLAKDRDPQRPVIFRSHIQVRADLADQDTTPTAEVWNWVWQNVRDCDVFVSHPVRAFVPHIVTPAKVAYLPATTDWKDGLNKQMHDWDNQYYLHEFKAQCFKAGMRQLAYPVRPYMVQIARFDPAKGIPDLLASYARFRALYPADYPLALIPQLVIAGHGAVDDPDASRIFAETELAIATRYEAYQSDIIVMRLGPSDQMLNVLMTCARVALQLSTREGFEVKVSEALHKGTPVIATHAGGIPLQVQHGKAGFLVRPGDHEAVARHLRDLFAGEGLQDRMSAFAEAHVSDEVGTVGNALGWLFLADQLAKGEMVQPEGRWVNDMARERAGVPYREGETRLPRAVG